jgi:hypothetical protein
MKNNFFKSILILATILFFSSSCKKEFDNPPVKQITSGSFINIANIKAKYSSNVNYKFKADSNLYCVVIADELSGNLYKDIYVKDITGALHIKLVSGGGIFIGDSIRINLKGVILNEYNKLIQLDSVDSEKSIVKLASGFNPQPISMTINQINANTAATNSVQSKLVKLDNVEFLTVDQNQSYADAIGKGSLNRIIKSCTGQTLTVRTSGYSNFASNLTPSGNGSIIGIASQYGTTMQLILRNNNEVVMTGSLCGSSTPNPTTTTGTYLNKNFDDNSITSGGWTSQNVLGSISWAASAFGGKSFAKVTNYVSTTSVNIACESWLISPPISLSTSTNPILSFQNAYKYTGAPLEVYVSTNYTSGLPSSATWVPLTFTLSAGNFVFISSGNISLSNYKNSNTRIAFKYLGSANDGSTWEIDDVLVKEN